MSEETGVKDFVNSFGFVGAAIRQAAQLRAFGQASGKFRPHATKMSQFVVSKKHHFPCNS
jgi:hypothetical protein